MHHGSDPGGTPISGRRPVLWDLGVALSLANVCWLPVWAALLNANNWYYVRCSPHWRSLATAGLGLAGSTLTIWLARSAARLVGGRVATTIGDTVFVVLVALACNALRLQLRSLALDSIRAALGIGGVAAALVLFALLPIALYRWRALLVPLAEKGLVCLLPFVGVVAFQAASLAYRSVSGTACGLELSDAAPGRPVAPRVDGGYRVLWVVFDDLDYELVYARRPEGLALPAFDALRRSSVFAEEAYPPASNTTCSLPALIVGRGVARAQRSGPAELRLRFDDGQTGRWSQQTTVFDRARALGVASALIGWYHPYCRIFGSRLAKCQWFQYLANPPGSWPMGGRAQLDLLINSLPGCFRLGLAQRTGLTDSRVVVRRAWHVALYKRLHREALASLRRPELGLIFAHYSIPHPPYVYDRAQRRFTVETAGTYEGNLDLADQTLAEIGHALDESGLADRTVLIVTSDHWHRHVRPAEPEEPEVEVGRPDQRVPFMVRLPRQNTGLAVSSVFRTTRTASLVLSMLRARSLAPDEIAAWMRAFADAGAD